MPDDRRLSKCVLPIVKFGGGSIFVWDCFSWYELGLRVPVQGTLESVVYETVLDNSALRSEPISVSR